MIPSQQKAPRRGLALVQQTFINDEYPTFRDMLHRFQYTRFRRFCQTRPPDD